MNVKICGVTRKEDALEAARLGAWAIGFIFTEKSPRFIAPADARSIVEALPPSVCKVGVVMNAPDVLAILRASNVNTIQFHGSEEPEVCRSVSVPWIKMIRSDADIDRYAGALVHLFDSESDTGLGGTGALADWNVAKSLSQRTQLLLAGGITAKNVLRAAAEVGPWGIDVASGVESRPGIKDFAKLSALFSAVENLRRTPE